MYFVWNKRASIYDGSGLGPRIIQQEPTLFAASVYQIILDGPASLNAAAFSVVDACKKAVLVHEFVAQLPKGYETWISLSGGQKQRLVIVIARTINLESQSPTCGRSDECA
ncbi:hypothetical protein E4U58_004025 [Claviceps cyperi]|nr:hypothetical protein E4U58_004025 [Claviceps cyperi]